MKTFIDNVQNNDHVGDDGNRPRKSYNYHDFLSMNHNAVGAIVPDRPFVLGNCPSVFFSIVPLFKLKPTGDRGGRPYVVYMKHMINYTNKIPLGILNTVRGDGNRPANKNKGGIFQ